jgi:broad specificity phosphatase PhoE
VILLVRHGQTEFNRERRLQGRMDSPLTELGLRQAEAVGELLAGMIRPEDGWMLASSPLGRARDSATVIGARLGLTVMLDDRLIEVSWGSREGRLRSELEADYPDTFGRTGWAFDTPEAEGLESVEARVASWLEDLPPEPWRRVIAVSHGVSGRVLRGLYADLSPGETRGQDAPQDAVFRLQNGQIDRFNCPPLD